MRFPALACAVWIVAASGQNIRPLTILHTNDLHAHFEPNDEGLGGFAYLAAEVRREKQGCTACIYLNAGDLVQGTPVSTIYHGVPVYQIANLLGIDASTLGNHEFDYGWKNIGLFTRTAKFPIVSANVVDERGEPATGRAYVIREAGGVRVAIIGVVMGNLAGNYSTPEQIGPWKVEPVVEAVRRVAREVQSKADLIVVLGHLEDHEVDEILREVPEAGIIIAGHNHGGFSDVHEMDHRYAVEGRSYGVELDRLNIQFDMAKHEVESVAWKRIPIDSHKITPAPDVEQIVGQWEAKVSKIVDVPIGRAVHKLEKPQVRRMIEKAMAEESGADIAWINAGNVRDPLPAGRILARQIWNILPFDNYIVVGTFLGSELPPKVMQDFPGIQADRMYKLATTDFSAENQASKDQFGVSGLKFPGKSKLQRYAVIDWVRKKKVIE